MSPVPEISSGVAGIDRLAAGRLAGAESMRRFRVAQVRAAVGDAAFSLEISIGIEQAVGIHQEIGGSRPRKASASSSR